MLAFMVDLATIGSTFFVGLALWRLGTLLQEFCEGREQHARGEALAATLLEAQELQTIQRGVNATREA